MVVAQKDSRNGKSGMKLVTLPMLRPLMFRCAILERFESLKILRDLYAGWQSLPAAFFETNLVDFLTLKSPLNFSLKRQ